MKHARILASRLARPTIRRLAPIVVVLGLCCAGGLASAQSRAEADAEFREGRRLMRAGDYPGACKHFELSQSLEPAVGTLLNLGACHEQQGKLATAWFRLNQAADLASRRGDGQRSERIRTLARELEPRLTRLEIRLQGTPPARLIVKRDGADVSRLLGRAMPVDPGSHTVEASAPDRKPWRRVVAATGEGVTIVVEIPSLPQRAVGREETANAIQESTGSRQPGAARLRQSEERRAPAISARSHAPAARPWARRRAGQLLTAGGAATLVAGVVFGVRAKRARDESLDVCPEGACPPDRGDGFDLYDEANTNANLANALVGVGLLATAGGLYLWLTAPEAASTTDAVSIQPSLSTSSVGLALTARF